MTEVIAYIVIGFYIYGWVMMFFGKKYVDDLGNPITRKQWKRLQLHETLYH